MMIIEVIFSTLDPQGQPNFAPMGVTWNETEMIARPFRNTNTYRNLVATGAGVVNVTDNVLTFAHTALDKHPPDVRYPQDNKHSADNERMTNIRRWPHFPARHVRGVVLEEACYWRELEVIDIAAAADGESERATVPCRVIGGGRRRDFLGFNRGKNAVIEATILATRLHLYPLSEIQAAFQRYREIVHKTGGRQEREAMQYLDEYLTRCPLASAR